MSWPLMLLSVPRWWLALVGLFGHRRRNSRSAAHDGSPVCESVMTHVASPPVPGLLLHALANNWCLLLLRHLRHPVWIPYGRLRARGRRAGRARPLNPWAGEPEIPRDTGDFRIINRRVIEELRRLKESHGFLRGLVALAGFRQAA